MYGFAVLWRKRHALAVVADEAAQDALGDHLSVGLAGVPNVRRLHHLPSDIGRGQGLLCGPEHVAIAGLAWGSLVGLCIGRPR